MRFEVIDRFDRKIRLSKERHSHIIERAEMVNQEKRIKETLAFPKVVKRSKHDTKAWLYYRFYDESPVTSKYLLVIVKILNNEGFIITSFYTNKIKEGEPIWEK